MGSSINLSDLPLLARVSDLERILPYRKSWIWAAARDGRFPKPVKLSHACTVWRRQDIELWLAERLSP